MESVDLVIIGAGFAGLAAAKSAAIRGLNVVVIDRKNSAGEKMHTTGIIVKEVADSWDIPSKVCHKVEGVRLYSPNMRSVDLLSPGYFFMTTEIKPLMEFFTEEATRAGAQVRFNQRFSKAREEKDSIIIEELNLSTKFLIGADGPKSVVAEVFGLAQNTQNLIGLELEYPILPEFDQNRLHCFIDSKIAPGYIGWVAPGKNITQIGLAARPPKEKRLEDFIVKLQKNFPSLQKVKSIGKRGGLIPVNGVIRPFYSKRVMLVGDSAGMVSPLTAGGIHTALDCGRLAGVAIANFLLNQGPHPGPEIAQVAPKYFFKLILRKIADFKFLNPIYNFFFNWVLFRKFLQIIYFHHQGLRSLKAWRELFLRTSNSK